MTITLQQFVALRPYAYHATSINNIPEIQADRWLHSAAKSIKQAGQSHLLSTRRAKSVLLKVDGTELRLQNQIPLQKANIALEGGWTFADLIHELNQRVFFWPGTEGGPIPHGARHIDNNLWDEAPVVLRVATQELLALNPTPSFCAFNSGAPRWSGGQASRRGPGTFLPAEEFERTCGRVVELVFQERAELPTSTTYRRGLEDWRNLFS